MADKNVGVAVPHTLDPFGWQRKAGRFVSGAEEKIFGSAGNLSWGNTTKMLGSEGEFSFRPMKAHGSFQSGSAFGEKASNWLSNHPLGNQRLGKVRNGVLDFANKLNDYTLKSGRGIQGGFQSLGAVAAHSPLKGLAKSYAIGTPLMFGIEVAFMGKPFSMGSMAETAWHNIPFTLGMELAGGGAKGLFKHMGYQMVGEHLGLGPWGSLGLQIAGSTYLPGIAPALAVGAIGYEVGKGIANMHKWAYEAGSQSYKSSFTTGDMSFATAEAATMRSRSISAIQNSHTNLRNMLGNEAALLMGR